MADEDQFGNDPPKLPNPFPADWDLPPTPELEPPTFVTSIVNRSTDFVPRRFTDPAAPEPPPPAPPILPVMGRGELRDMLHAATVHILDLERRVSALETPLGPADPHAPFIARDY